MYDNKYNKKQRRNLVKLTVTNYCRKKRKSNLKVYRRLQNEEGEGYASFYCINLKILLTLKKNSNLLFQAT